MFAMKWRQHLGLAEDPFTCEDADKDVILAGVDTAATHSGFDRIFGNPRVPAPGIVFGEKGSGKSALRLTMARRLEEYNEANEGERVFLVEYVDFNGYLEEFRRAQGLREDGPRAVQEVVRRWRIADHLDCILSLGVTKLFDELVVGQRKIRTLSRKQILDVSLFTALYYNSPQLTGAEAHRKLRPLVGAGSMRGVLRWLALGTLALAGIALFCMPLFFSGAAAHPLLWHVLGGGLCAGTVLWAAFTRACEAAVARRAVKSIRVLPRDGAPLADFLKSLPRRQRQEFVLPRGSDEDLRYTLLRRFLGLLKEVGYQGLYVLLDRIDEPSLLSGNAEAMRAFVEKLLDIKLLQYPQVGIKMFLPIELDAIYRNAAPEQLKRMRLDKSNLIPDLRWTGQELFEIANQRVQACKRPGSSLGHLADLFEEGFDFGHLRETLAALGTPRYAFGFFASLFTEHVRDLPGELAPEDPRWRVGRAVFDIVRSGWLQQSGLLRRVLN